MKISPSVHRRLHWFNLPTVSLLAFLQRSPAVRIAIQAEEFVMASPIGAVLKSLAASAAALGAMNSLAGATPLVPSSGDESGISVEVGKSVSVGFTVTPTQTPIQSWHIGGTIPPGMSFSGRTTPGTANTQSLLLGGSPTTAGDYMVTLQAFDQLNESGFPSAVYGYTIHVTGAAAVAPSILTQPQSQSLNAGGNVVLTAGASGSPAPVLQWRRNGAAVGGGTNATLALNSVQSADTGLYTLTAANASGSATSNVAIVGILTAQKVIGFGLELSPVDIRHQNGRVFDQVLLNGVAESITADPDQVTRTSYIDDDDDIVQVEFSGPGTLSLVLTASSGPAAPVNYNQPSVSYMKGHAGIVITGADEHTNVSVFTVGRATAFDPTGAFNFLEGASETNDPAKNGSSLFVGHEQTAYDGIADIAFIAIQSTNGKFGGVRTSNANYYASGGYTGVYAPGVAFQGPVFVGDISAFDTATPVLVLGSASDTRVTGGDMTQANGQAVTVSGVTQLKFTPGSDSHGHLFAAQANKAVYKQDGVEVTAQIVVNP
jgi:hypothetical protein